MSAAAYRIDKLPKEFRVHLSDRSQKSLDEISRMVGQRVAIEDFDNQLLVVPRPGRMDITIETTDPEAVEAMKAKIIVTFERMALQIGKMNVVSRATPWC